MAAIREKRGGRITEAGKVQCDCESVGVTNVREAKGEAGSADGFGAVEVPDKLQGSERWTAVECTLGELDAHTGGRESECSKVGEVVLACGHK